MSDNTAEKQEELDLEVEIIDDTPDEDKNKVQEQSNKVAKIKKNLS